MLLEKSIKISLNLLDWNTTNIVKDILIFPAEDMQKNKAWSSKSADTANSSNLEKKIIVTQHFRPKSTLLNDKEYCKPIDRTLEMLFNERSGSVLWLNIPE